MTIYFDENKNAYAFEIENYTCSIDDEVWEEYAGTDKWDIVDGVFTDITNTEEYKEKKRKEKQLHISNLICTKRVLILMLEELGLDYFKQIQPLIEANRQAKLEWELASELLRSNPLIDIIGLQLGITHEQLDRLFQYANGEVETLEVNNG